MGQVAPNHPVCAPGAGEADPLIFCAHLLPNETMLEGLMASHRQARPWPPDLGKPLPLTRAPACFSAGVEGERGLRRAWTWVQPHRSPSRSNLCLGFRSGRAGRGGNERAVRGAHPRPGSRRDSAARRFRAPRHVHSRLGAGVLCPRRPLLPRRSSQWYECASQAPTASGEGIGAPPSF